MTKLLDYIENYYSHKEQVDQWGYLPLITEDIDVLDVTQMATSTRECTISMVWKWKGYYKPQHYRQMKRQFYKHVQDAIYGDLRIPLRKLHAAYYERNSEKIEAALDEIERLIYK